jgi:hypothetical protein
MFWQCGRPPQESKRLSGTQVVQVAARLSPVEREKYLLSQLAKDSLPTFLRTFRPVTLTATAPNGQLLQGMCFVMPDYLAVGTDKDFVRIPLQPKTAQKVADALGCTLPTRKLVDAIYAAAKVKLEPIPLTKDRDSVRTFLLHNQLIENQRKGQKLGLLTAGPKKDVVLTPRLKRQPRANRVAIYGWHKTDGSPIQPLYLGHIETYTDYSQGIRLVLDRFEVAGSVYTLQQLLAHPLFKHLVCDEEICEPVRY